MVDDIIRPATVDERKDFIELKRVNKDIFAEKVTEKEQEMRKKFRPYCMRCANYDYQDKIKNLKMEAVRAGGDMTAEQLAKMNFDFEKYGEVSRFQLLDESDVNEAKIIDGVRAQYKTGTYKNYKCKVRGCGHTVFVPVDNKPKTI